MKRIPGAVVGGAISAVRLPADALLVVVGRRKLGDFLERAIDRVDGAARAVAGTVLRDRMLANTAHLRREAAEERKQAIGLRDRAEALNDEAKALVLDAKLHAKRQREAAAKRSKERVQSARQQAEETEQGAAEVTEKRKATARKDAAKKLEQA